jgi:hypothetical protein
LPFRSELFSSLLLSRQQKIKINKIIILPSGFYDCGTWPPKLNEEHGLKVFKNRVKKKIFKPKRENM